MADDFDFEALAGRLATHWGETGGTPKDKDGEIRVRMGKLSKQPWLGRTTATGVFCRGYVENKGDVLAPQVKQRVFDGVETLAKLLILNGLLKLPAKLTLAGCRLFQKSTIPISPRTRIQRSARQLPA